MYRVLKEEPKVDVNFIDVRLFFSSQEHVIFAVSCTFGSLFCGFSNQSLFHMFRSDTANS